MVQKEYSSLMYGKLKDDFINNLKRSFINIYTDDEQETLRKKIINDIRKGTLKKF